MGFGDVVVETVLLILIMLKSLEREMRDRASRWGASLIGPSGDDSDS